MKAKCRMEARNTAKARGTGLGLAISRQELEEVAGRLDFDPSHRGGARFILTVPLDDGTAS